MAQQLEKKILVVTSENFYSGPIITELKGKFGEANVTVLNPADVPVMEPKALQAYAAIVQATPRQTPQIFDGSKIEGFEAATRLLEELRLKAGAKPPILCVSSILDENTAEMGLKLNGKNITITSLESQKAVEIAENVSKAIAKSMAK